ncbi:hypothetical protein KGF57_001076 [Candida theae]|uniref:RING-type domain-containing protein n=1 Tax=Candida theae TaxID=1198502 RepID=A0AAD5G034_9ASCO|nr:uncharacterized protein KGF57_001076 [Candida theae]KAI5964403.1 hypothetical protein KGF57_001076 [Candida theae]
MSANVTNSTLIDLATDNDTDFSFLKLIESVVEAIWEQSSSSELNNDAWSRFGAISTYCCSVYGLACLVMALILNRTLVMASTNSIHNQQVAINRQRQISGNRGLIDAYKRATNLKKVSILSFRVGIIMILLYQISNVLTALKLNQFLGLTESSSIKWFYSLIPARFFTYVPEKFAETKYMNTPSRQVMIGPTSDMYWPIFLTFCCSAFVETFIACIQGRKPFTESGITIFEHSLAFQEFSTNSAFFFSNSYNYKRPTEVLLITSLFSILNHLNIHVGAILNDNKYRLIPSATLGLGYLAYFISSIWKRKVFQFPIILVLTFTPQVLILFVIFVSLTILMTAVAVNGFRLEGLNYASFFSNSNGGEQSEDNVGENEVDDEQNMNSLENINIKWSDDFYTALLNLGVLAITSAGKSSYIKELSLVTLDNETWVERSLWQQVQSGQTSHTNEASFLEVMKQKRRKGYSNLIDTPTSKLVTHGESNAESNHASRENPYQSSSIFKRRFLYLRRIVFDFAQLVYGVVASFILRGIPGFFSSVFKRGGRSTRNMRRDGISGNGSHGSDVLSSKQILQLDNYTVEQLEQNYAAILAGTDLPNIDNSEDYVGTQEESDYESDAEVIDLTTDVNSRSMSRVNDYAISSSPLHEIFDSEGLKELFEESNETSLQLIREHLNYEGRLTRSRYHKLHQNTDSKTDFDSKDESEKLVELIIAKRSENKEGLAKEGQRSMECVICQTNMREIITWPCKCFAICESCRLSLVSKGFEGCVCCRRDVEGVSKIYLP